MVWAFRDWKFVFNGFDFDEPQNLAGDLAHAKRMREMMTQIWRRIHETNDRTLLGIHYPSMRMARVGPNAGRG